MERIELYLPKTDPLTLGAAFISLDRKRNLIVTGEVNDQKNKIK